MTAFVHVHAWGHWFYVGDRRNIAIQWRPELRLVDLVPVEMAGRVGLTVHKNGVEVPSHQWASMPVSPEDHVDFAVRPADPGTVGTIVSQYLVPALIGAAVSFVISLILPKPKGPKKRGDEESPAYGFGGSDNVRVEGQPKQVIYGHIRYAPQILDEFVRTQTAPPQADLYLLLGLGEGPIQAVGDRTTDSAAGAWLSTEDDANPIPSGIEIESNPATNFNGILAQVRLGTNEQEPLLGFEQVHTLSTTGQTLDQQETSTASNSGTAWNLATFPYNSNDASVQAIWDEYAQAFDMPHAADSIVAKIDFPEGLYRLDSGSGSLADAFFRAIMRYQELDGGGSPITTGGDNGDGWVYVPMLPTLSARRQGPFAYEIGTVLRSPAAYTSGAQGRVLDAFASGAYAVTAASAGGAAANASTPWTAGGQVDGFTVEGWVWPQTVPEDNTGSATRSIFEWHSTAGGTRGVSLAFVRISGIIDGTTQYRWRTQVFWGDGVSSDSDDYDASSVPVNPYSTVTAGWQHIAFTFTRNLTGGNHTLRLYHNGQLRKQWTNPNSLVAPAAPMYLGRTTRTAAGTVAGGVRFDEFRVWSVARTSQQILAAYSSGLGQFGTDTTNLVAGWHFDGPDVLTAFTYSNDYGTRNNDITISGSGSIGDPTTAGVSVVYRPGTGSTSRIKARVQLMRFNLKSTSTYVADRSEWSTLDSVVEAQIAYPNTAVLALKIPATDQLNTSTPRVTVEKKGRKVPVWDGLSTVAPSFTDTWSANPAWVCLDMLQNRRYGRAGEYEVDLVSLKEWADYCDAKIYDAKGSASIHSTNSAIGIANLKYDSSLFSSYGGIEISFRVGFKPPTHWIVGGFLGFVGIAAPPTSGISVDINTSNISGMEIGSMVFASSAWTVTVKYDRATYGDPWLDSALLSTIINPTAVTGSVQGRETRFRFDGAFDTFGNFWDQLLLVAGSARATPVLEGRRIRFRVARPRSPVGIITHASIKPDSFSIQYTGPSERPNAYVADFLDADRNWQRATAERIAASVEAGAPEGAFNRENVDLFGVTRRSQVLRDLDFRLNVNELLVRQGSFEVGVQALPYESGDVVVLAHDLVPWGQSGRFDVACTGTTVVVDREIVLAAATTYYLQVRFNAQGQDGAGSTTADYMETREITSAAGTYIAGNSITIASAFTFDPAPDDEYLVYADSERKLAEIAEITLNPDWSRKVTWIQYDDDTFDVDTLPQDIPPELQFSTIAPPTTSRQIPEPVLDLTVREHQSRDASGAWQPELHASWVLEPVTAEHVVEVAVFARPNGEGEFEEVARRRGPATSAMFRVPWLASDSNVEVAVQPITSRGVRASPLRCARSLVSIGTPYVAPPAPTNLRAVLNGNLVTYSWDPPANARGLSYELRRGGWVLGQIVGVASDGSTSLGPTPNWSAATDNARGDGPPQLVLRARDSRGHCSTACILEGFNPAPAGSQVLVPPNVVGQRVNGDQRWEDYGTDWDGGTPAPTLTDVEIHVLDDGRKVLRISGSALTGTYETAVGTIDADTKPEHGYVEAFATAIQVAPLTADEELSGADDPASSRVSAEGLITRRDPSLGCTLTIEWRFKLAASGSYTEWQVFSPGAHYFLVPQFRLTLTRPDTSWNAWVYSLGTRLSRVAVTKNVKTPTHVALEAQLVSLG